MNRNRLFLNLFVVSVTLLLFANCTGSRNAKPVSVDHLLTNAGSLIGETVIVDGLCTHVCAKSGMKLFLQGSDAAHTLRAESDATLGKFDPENVGKKVRVWGKLVEERIDEAYLQELEKEINSNVLLSHGEGGEGGEGCETEQAAEGVATGSSEMERVNQFRQQIAERKASEGKEYLSQFHIAAESCQIID